MIDYRHMYGNYPSQKINCKKNDWLSKILEWKPSFTHSNVKAIYHSWAILALGHTLGI